MAYYDEANWREWCLYTISSVETGCTWNSVEGGTHRGIGITQWSFGRSWELLNLYAKNNPEEAQQNLPILYNSVKPGSTKWNDHVFYDAEYNELINCLGKPNAIQAQIDLWNSDLDNEYIKILKNNDITDAKSGIYALSIYHHSPQAFYQVLAAVGGGANYQSWYKGACNNGIVGSYRTRQDGVKSKLDSWDGSSNPPNNWSNVGGKTINGGNYNWNSGNSVTTTGTNNQTSAQNNPNSAQSETNGTITINNLLWAHNEMRLFLNVGGASKVITFLRNSIGMWIPVDGGDILENINGTNNQPNATPDYDAEEEDEPTEPTKRTKNIIMLDYFKGLKGRITYSQAQSQRLAAFTQQTGDCSGTIYACANKAGIHTMGTWTGTMITTGKLIGTYSNDQDYINNYVKNGKLQGGDICIFFSSSSNSSHYHAEMIDTDGTLWGVRGSYEKGPTQVQKPSNGGGNYNHIQVRRYVVIKKNGGQVTP